MKSLLHNNFEFALVFNELITYDNNNKNYFVVVDDSPEIRLFFHYYCSTVDIGCSGLWVWPTVSLDFTFLYTKNLIIELDFFHH